MLVALPIKISHEATVKAAGLSDSAYCSFLRYWGLNSKE